MATEVTLERQLAEAVSDLFRREMPRYEGMLELLLADVVELIDRGPSRGLPRCTVQSRIKTVQSLRNKIEGRLGSRGKSADAAEPSGLDGALARAISDLRNAQKEQPDYVDSLIRGLAPGIVDAVPDLIGVRLLPYDRVDLRLMNENLKILWAAATPDSPFHLDGDPIVKDGGGYEATHYRVIYHPGGLEDWWKTREGSGRLFLKGIHAEVQTTTLLRHVLNELNHDFVYKPNDEAGLAQTELDPMKQFLLRIDTHLTNAQGEIDRVTKRGREVGLLLAADPEDRLAVIPASAPSGTSSPTDGSGPRGPVRQADSGALIDGALLVLTPPQEEGPPIQEWAKATGYPSDALHATWEADRARLRWKLNPAQTHSATALTKLIRQRSGVTDRLRPVDGPAYWALVTDDGAVGPSLKDLGVA